MSLYQNEIWLNETEKQIRALMNNMGIERMPTRSETEFFYGDGSLSNRIMKSGGFKGWASKLGLGFKKCGTYFGNKYEELTAKKLRLLFDDVKRTPVKFPYDIVVNGKTKIDVKASRLFKGGTTGAYYTFNLESKYPRSDFYVVCCIADNDEIEKTLVLPSFVMAGKVQLSIGKISVYDKYIERWDLIEKHEKMMQELEVF